MRRGQLSNFILLGEYVLTGVPAAVAIYEILQGKMAEAGACALISLVDAFFSCGGYFMNREIQITESKGALEQYQNNLQK